MSPFVLEGDYTTWTKTLDVVTGAAISSGFYNPPTVLSNEGIFVDWNTGQALDPTGATISSGFVGSGVSNAWDYVAVSATAKYVAFLLDNFHLQILKEGFPIGALPVDNTTTFNGWYYAISPNGLWIVITGYDRATGHARVQYWRGS